LVFSSSRNFVAGDARNRVRARRRLFGREFSVRAAVRIIRVPENKPAKPEHVFIGSFRQLTGNAR
jgi:hypothetical protein